MSEQKDFIKRMEIAVIKAYKSISVLKEENKKLSDENILLKQELQQFYIKKQIGKRYIVLENTCDYFQIRVIFIFSVKLLFS
jgi:hypothetical protein